MGKVKKCDQAWFDSLGAIFLKNVFFLSTEATSIWRKVGAMKL